MWMTTTKLSNLLPMDGIVVFGKQFHRFRVCMPL